MPACYRQFTPAEWVEHQSGLFVTPTETAQPDASTNTAAKTQPSLIMPVTISSCLAARRTTGRDRLLQAKPAGFA